MHKPAYLDAETLLDELSALGGAAGADVSTNGRSGDVVVEFYARLLGRLQVGLGAAGGAVWATRPDGLPELIVELRLSELGLEAMSTLGRSHQLFAAAAARGAQAALIGPEQSLPGSTAAANPTSYLLTVAPVMLDGQAVALVEIIQPDLHFDGGECLAVVRAAAEIATEFHQAEAMRQLRTQHWQWTQYQQFVRQIHRPLDLRAVCYAIANEARLLVGCDRVTVLAKRGRRQRVQAVSGVDTVDPRATMAARLEVLAQPVAKIEQELWYNGEASDSGLGVEDLLSSYLDVSPVRAIAMIPLRDQPAAGEEEPGRVNGMLVAEWFHNATFDEAARQRLRSLAEQAGIAVERAQELRQIPLLGLMRSVGRLRWLAAARQLPKTVAAIAILTAAILALILVPAEFRVEARGELQPVERAIVFAPTDGIVRSIAARQGADVRKGEVLIELRNPQLELEISRVDGERQRAQRRLESVTSERLNPPDIKDEKAWQLRLRQLAAEEEELKVAVPGLEREAAALRKQEAELKLQSPLSGTLLTWNAEQDLQARPVQRGQALLTVANLQGAWALELKVPDAAIGHVARARESAKQPLPVTFSVGTDPTGRHSAKLDDVSLTIDTDAAGQSSAHATIKLPKGLVPEPRAGATVVARIHCGQRSLGYVWFHGVWEAIGRWF